MVGRKAGDSAEDAHAVSKDKIKNYDVIFTSTSVYFGKFLNEWWLREHYQLSLFDIRPERSWFAFKIHSKIRHCTMISNLNPFIIA